MYTHHETSAGVYSEALLVQRTLTTACVPTDFMTNKCGYEGRPVQTGGGVLYLD